MMLRTFTGALMLLLIAAGPASGYSSQLKRYPYLTDVVNSGTNGYATVNWATDRSATTGSVRWGAVAGDGSCAPITSVAATRTSITVNSVPEYQWKTKLTLTPDRQYCYRPFLGSVDLLAADPTPRFRTQAQGPGSFSFAVFGDWGYSDATGVNNHQANVIRRISESGVRFAVTTGDQPYGTGTHTNWGDLVTAGQAKSTIFGPVSWTLAGASVPLFASLGNHGLNSVFLTNLPQDRAVETSGGRYQMDTYCCLNGTTSKAYPSAWYAFDAGNVRVYVLDTAWADSNSGTGTPYANDYGYHWTQSSAEYQWLKADLEAHSNAVKFAVFHYPLYSDNPNESSDTFLRGVDSLEGLLSRNGVDIGFSGHAHMYQRNLKPPGGLITYLTGGGGAKLQPIGPCSAIDAYGIGWSNSSSKGSKCGSATAPTSIDRVYHFLLVTVNGTSVTVAPTDELGRTFDVQTYDFSAPADTVPPSPPSGLVAIPASGSQVNLGWNASSDNVGVEGYQIFRRPAGGSSWTLIATTGVRLHPDTTVTPSSSYEYQVKAFDAAANVSGPSNTAAVTTPGGPVTLRFAPEADARVEEGTPNENFGTSTRLYVDGSPNKKSYLRFTVSGVSSPIQSAKLRMFAFGGSTNGPSAYSAGSSWTETGITWANRPVAGSGPFDDKGAVASNTWVEFDVRPIVTGNGTYTFLVEPTSTDGVDFYSKEASSERPELVVTVD